MTAVSVLVPAYNAERFVDATLQSVCEQTYPDWEVVAVDDRSSDRTFDRLRHWADREPRIRALRNEANRGMTGNWNECLRHATGEYVIKLDADDVFRPRTLELLVGALGDSSVVGAGVRTLLCTEELEPLDGLPGDDAMMRAGIDPYKDQVLPCERWLTAAVMGHQFWSSDAVLLRRDTLLALGGYDARYGCASDTDLVLRLLSRPGHFAHFGYVGVLYRMVGGSVSHQFRANNWLTWEGCVTNLVALHRYRPGRRLSRTLRLQYVELWQRWRAFCRSPEAAALPEAIRRRLQEAAAEVAPPPRVDRLLWRGRRWLHRLPV